MAVNNGVVTAPVGLAEVASLLGVSQSVGTVCTTTAVNMWAKYKPVAVANRLGVLTEAQRKAVNYGIVNVPYFNYIGQMASWMRTGSPSPVNSSSLTPDTDGYFSYKKPTGGMASPLRMTDFVDGENPTTRGYFNGAKPFIGQYPSDECRISLDGDLRVEMPLGPQDNLSIRLQDLIIDGITDDTSNYYFGVCFTNANRTFFITQSPSENVSENGFDGTIAHIHEATSTVVFPDLNTSWAGQYLMFGFVSEYCISSVSQTFNTQCKCVPLAMTAKTVTISAARLDVEFVTALAWRTGGTTQADRKYLYYTVSLQNNSTDYTAIALTGDAVAYVYNSAGQLMTSANIGSGNIIINSGQTFTASARSINLGANLELASYVKFYVKFRRSGDYSTVIAELEQIANVSTGLPRD